MQGTRVYLSAAAPVNPVSPGEEAELSSRTADAIAYELKDFKAMQEAMFAATRVGPALVRLTLK